MQGAEFKQKIRIRLSHCCTHSTEQSDKDARRSPHFQLLQPMVPDSTISVFGCGHGIWRVALVLITWPCRKVVHKYKDSLLIRIMRDILIRSTKFFLSEFEGPKGGWKIEKECAKQSQIFNSGMAVQNTSTSTDTKRTYKLYGIKVKKFFIHLLFLLRVILILTSAVTFFSAFLTETAFSCIENFDCFLMTEEDKYSEDKLEDCENFTSSEIICFRLAYKYSEALGEAGGYLYVMRVVMNLLTWMSVRLGDYIGDYHKKWQVTAIAMIISGIFVFLTVLLPSFATLERPDVYDTFRTPKRQLQLVIYAYSNIIMVVIPPVGAYCAYPENTEMKNTSSMQPPNDFYKENPVYEEGEDEEYPSTQ